jgi:hypothetical protein
MQNANWLLNISARCIGLLACIIPLLLKPAQRGEKPPDHRDVQTDPLKLVERYLDDAGRMILQYQHDSMLNG